jgi:Tfp pilus assembly protein PilO
MNKKNLQYALLFVALIGYYSYDTLYPEYTVWETQIVEVQKKLSQARITAPRLVQIRDQERDLEEKLKLSLTRLPSGSELADLLSLVIPVMEKVGITTEQIGIKSIAAEIPQEIYRIHVMNFANVQGLSLTNIIELIYELRNFERIINVKDLNFASEPAAEGFKGEARYTLTMNIETYSYIEADAEK